MSINTTPEYYDDQVEEQAQPLTQEEILMSEQDILAGLLEAGMGRDNEENYRKIQIKRNGRLLFEFRIRPLTEDESLICWRSATRYAPSKFGQPKVAIETNQSKYRAYLIYTATVNEDRAKTWDNKKAQEGVGVFQGVDMIEKVLLAGEKTRILDQIDEISGADEWAEESAGN